MRLKGSFAQHDIEDANPETTVLKCRYNVLTWRREAGLTGMSTTRDTSPRIALDRTKSRRFCQTPVRVETRTDIRSGEERVLELGHTNAGRILFVARTPRGKLRRPVTAFDAKSKNPRRVPEETQ